MTDCLDVVTIWADNERPVIVGVIDLANTWRAVVFCAGFEGSLIECINLCAAIGNKGNVHWVLWLGVRTKPEFRLAVSPEAGPALNLHDRSDAEGSKGLDEEGFALRVVAHGKANMVNDHVNFLQRPNA